MRITEIAYAIVLVFFACIGLVLLKLRNPRMEHNYGGTRESSEAQAATLRYVVKQVRLALDRLDLGDAHGARQILDAIMALPDARR